MSKRSKAKAAQTVAEHGPKLQANPAAADTAEADPEPAPKRPRAGRKQSQDNSAVEDAQLPAAKRSAGRKASGKQQQKQQEPEQASEQQEQQGPEPTAAADEAVKPKKAAPGKRAVAAAAAKPAAEKPPYYLVKSEPQEFSIEDLEAKPNQTEPWEGVRNAQARNIMRGMAVGDLAFFYHSSCKVPGIVGIAQVVREAYPDPTAFDPKSKYYDASSSEDSPKWWMVDWKFIRKLKRQITLEELKGHKDGPLDGMALFNRPRLSVQLVTKGQWDFVLSLEEQDA